MRRSAIPAFLAMTSLMDDPQNILAAIYRAVDWINDGLSPDHQLVKATEQEIEDAFGVAVT